MNTENKTALGIEFGSTRIKTVLIDPRGEVLASGSYRWENSYVNGLWTYPLEAVWTGLAEAYRVLKQEYRARFGETLCSVGAIGVSAMMHGYLAFDQTGKQLAEFRTWRNTVTAEAAEILSSELCFNIPQRWSCAHLYQAILNQEPEGNKIAFMTTLSGYVHEKLTGHRVLGIGDASGMFPIDYSSFCFDAEMLKKFDALTNRQGFPHKLETLLPQILCAGEEAGKLTPEGALLIDPEGDLMPGIPFCPPEGDMQTGMVATDSVRLGTGNISAGTSINACIIPQKPIQGVYSELDIVATPDGKPSALLHGNNCTSELDVWAGMLKEAAEAVGAEISLGQMLDAMFDAALKGSPDADGIVYYNYLSGETIVHLDEGRPLLLRGPDSRLSFANFARSQLYAAMAVLRIGLDTLLENEGVQPTFLIGHGGFFKTPTVGQKLMAGALNTPIGVLRTAGEGGPWGMALLALYAIDKKDRTLADFLDETVFATQEKNVLLPDPADVEGFDRFLLSYRENLAVERSAVTVRSVQK